MTIHFTPSSEKLANLKRKGYVVHNAGTINFIIITSHGIFLLVIKSNGK